MSCAALVFALGLFASSPILHGQLHHDSEVAVGDDCAVVLFATGVSIPLAIVAPVPPSTEWREAFSASTSEIHLDSPRYLLQPERGPPVA